MIKCPYFGKCGGCKNQDVEYPEQLKEKKRVVEELLGEELEVYSGEPYNYRNRMDFVFHKEGLGFREKGKWWKIIDIERCEIAEEEINKTLLEIRQFFKGMDVFDLREKKGTLRYAVIRKAKEMSVSFVVNKESEYGAVKERIKEYADKTKVENVLITYVPHNTDVSISEEYEVIKGKDYLEQQYLGKTFEFSIQGFFQNNQKMAEKMQKYVYGLIDGGTHLLDLYSGVGTFGIINSDKFEKVTLLESFQGCVESAQKNIQKNKANNTQAICIPDRKIKHAEIDYADVIITDTPRCGMHPKTIKWINEHKPKKLIYVSCNPKQLSKELQVLEGFQIGKTALFDFFPHTPHMEVVVELNSIKNI